MSQTFQLPTDNTTRRAALVTDIPNALNALRSIFSGDSEPSNPVAYQLWLRTTDKALLQRNSLNNAWVVQKRREVVVQLGALAAKTWRCLRADVPLVVASLTLMPSTTTSTSVATTKEWTFLAKNQTSGLNLFSATPSTATTVSGVGGGELTADAGKVLTPNQNASLAVGDLLYFVVGVNGSPTAVADCALSIGFYELGS